MSNLMIDRQCHIVSSFRRTRRGSIVKIVREHYLRKDIYCGVEKCVNCRDQPKEILISSNPRKGISSLLKGKHVVIPDASVFFNQMDVLEDDSFCNDIVILQSIRNEVRSKSLSLFSRIKNFARHRRLFMFMNEYHEDTYQGRINSETSVEYTFRLITHATRWYQEHIRPLGIEAILLVEDESTKSKVLSSGIKCLLFTEYVESLYDNKNLLDKIVRPAEKMDIDEVKRKAIYVEHLTLPEMQNGIKSGKYFQAKLEISRDNYLEGSVTVMMQGEATRVLIIGREKINRAIHEDIVAIELCPEKEWRGKSDIVLTADVPADGKEADEIEEPIDDLEKSSENLTKRPTGRVVGIVRRKWRQYCGTLRDRSADIMETMVVTSHYFVPAEKRIPFIRIETRQYDKLKNQRIVVAIDSWPIDSKYPRGHYVRALGEIGDKNTENELILLEHDVPHSQFSKQVMKCLPDPDTWSIPESEMSYRLDLRSKVICSVDPPGCTDIDDALHCVDLGNGIYEVGVHIADVSYFVECNTPLDLEAASRGTTVYLVDNRIDMIPTILSSNLCSLIEKNDRLTFSVIWKIKAKTAEIVETQFHKSVICSKSAMTYAEAQLKIDSPHLKDELTMGLRRLNNLAKILRQKRLDNGALVLASSNEIKFVEIDTETHDNVTRIETKELLETNSMVEEFMLLANISVAEKLYQELPQLALLRCHQKPGASNFDELTIAAKSRGIEVDVKDGHSLSESLDKLKDPSNPYFNLMFRMITTRCMTQAQYFCTGKNSDPKNFWHFGLAIPIYTHFTSPIRRYADLIVHRLLTHIIGVKNLDPTLTSSENIQKICENINYRHRQAQYASRSSIKLHTIIHIKSAKKPLEEDGYILFVRKNALQILIPRLAFETTYFLNPLADWNYDGLKARVTHIHSNIKLKQFQSVKVKLILVDNSNGIRKGLETISVQIIRPKIPSNE